MPRPGIAAAKALSKSLSSSFGTESRDSGPQKRCPGTLSSSRGTALEVPPNYVASKPLTRKQGLFVRQVQERELGGKGLELGVFMDKNRLMEPRDGGDDRVSER